MFKHHVAPLAHVHFHPHETSNRSNMSHPNDACHLLTAFNHSFFPPSNACLLSSQPNQLSLFPINPFSIPLSPTPATCIPLNRTQQAYESTLLRVVSQRPKKLRCSSKKDNRVTRIMEDPELEWAIQEYSPPSKEGETTMVRWILNKGYVIGKKMVITGIAITSAPLVLPPLAVFSAMGIAFSVPFGFVFASYVCTNTLMNRLLPSPPTTPSPLLLEYYVDEEDEGVDCKFDFDEGGDDYVGDEFRNEIVIQQEEEEGILEIEEKLEALMMDADGDVDVDEKGYSTDDEEKGEEDDIKLENLVQEDYSDLMEEYKQEIEALIGEMEENLGEDEDEKEMGDQDDVVQRAYDIEDEEREQMEDINQGMEMRLGFDMADDEHKVSATNSSGVDENWYDEDDGEYVEEDDDRFQEERNKDEMEEIVKESTELLEKIRDEGKIHDEVEHESASNEVFEEGMDVEMREPVIVKEIESHKLVKDEGKNEEPVGEMHRVVILAEGNEENNFNSREVEELDLVAREVMREDMEKTSFKTSNDGSEDAILETKKEHLIDSNEDAREIGDENRLDLLDERNSSMNTEVLEGGNEVKENTTDEHVEIIPLLGHAPLDLDDVKVASKTESKEVSTNSSDVNEQVYEEDNVDYLGGDDDSLQEQTVRKEEETRNEMEEIVKESTGLLEKIRDEGKIHDEVEHESASNEVLEEVTVIDIESKKLVKDESKNEEVVDEIHTVVILSEGNDENNFNSRDMEKNSCKTSEDGIDQDVILKTKKEHLIDLFDESNTTMNIKTLKGDEEVKENTNNDADVMTLPGFRHARLDSDNVEVTSKPDRKTPSREDVLEDEKIWEKIGAMRAIVGYKAPSQPTSIEELKALYVFTGVEPPTSFKGEWDPHEVNVKLKFLMSIVGVK
ncbi:hypothetical protein LXL04_021522 [Taraxacum kok-saghyz]